MQIAQNNKISNKNLDLRLRLAVRYYGLWKKNQGDRNIVERTNVVIEDKIDNAESGLDIDFEIERTMDDKPNTCKLTIWNLSENTFNQIATRANNFEISYARGNNDWSVLFEGVPYFASMGNPVGGNNDAKGFLKRDDAVGGENDIPTVIYLQESLNQYEQATISKSYQGYVSTEKIIKDCAEALGFPVNIAQEIIHVNVNNYVARGRVCDVLSDITKRLQVELDIGTPKVTYANNNVNIFADSSAGVVLIDRQSPTLYGYVFDKTNSTRPEKEQSDEEEFYRFKTQLLSDLIAGNYCKCDFSNLSGIKQIKKVVSIGNNYGTAGETEVYIGV